MGKCTFEWCLGLLKFLSPSQLEKLRAQLIRISTRARAAEIIEEAQNTLPALDVVARAFIAAARRGRKKFLFRKYFSIKISPLSRSAQWRIACSVPSRACNSHWALFRFPPKAFRALHFCNNFPLDTIFSFGFLLFSSPYLYFQ
jgi:hypothetical protein